jgi:hypothetical protein
MKINKNAVKQYGIYAGSLLALNSGLILLTDPKPELTAYAFWIIGFQTLVAVTAASLILSWVRTWKRWQK